jgi:hypothetical protein
MIVPARPYDAIFISTPNGDGAHSNLAWSSCCTRADNGMEGSALYRMVIKASDAQESMRPPLYSFLLGVLVYREDARKDPLASEENGDVYAAISGKVGSWVNEQIGRPWPQS